MVNTKAQIMLWWDFEHRAADQVWKCRQKQVSTENKEKDLSLIFQCKLFCP